MIVDNTKSGAGNKPDWQSRYWGGLTLVKCQEIVRTKGLRAESGPDDS
ncbi:hypothetical protein [Sphingopyxis sp. BSNA05]|nr:hypothetical protein [Sphingopyxis sp. BSNA05]